MAEYKTYEVLSRLNEIFHDGYDLVDITQIADDDSSEFLSFNVRDEYSDIAYDSVDAYSPDDDQEVSITFKSTDIAPIPLSFSDVHLAEYAVERTLEYLKILLKDETNTRDDIAAIKSESVKLRNLQAKLKKFFKDYSS